MRRGVPTRILINLCVSLVALQLVLYFAEHIAVSRLGCRLSNVFRYYIIMVSLFWNGVEAYNMYQMLVRVFNSPSQRSHFVTKAAIVAWGLLHVN